jgi:hypothetical protein
LKYILFYFCSGKKEERNYENGVLNGSAVTYGIDGDKFEFTYVDGRIEGNYSINIYYCVETT